MSAFTWAWIGWGLAFVAIEGIALFNSRRGDTLSEHAWAWLGVGAWKRVEQRGGYVGPGDGPIKASGFVTPKWTLRVARIVLISFMVWLTLHFATGGWV